jgi:hypothetical protein
MSSDQELTANICRQLERLSSQLQEHQRDLQVRGNSDGQALVQSGWEATERLLRDVREGKE